MSETNLRHLFGTEGVVISAGDLINFQSLIMLYGFDVQNILEFLVNLFQVHENAKV
jgi:hypothetical protein